LLVLGATVMTESDIVHDVGVGRYSPVRWPASFEDGRRNARDCQYFLNGEDILPNRWFGLEIFNQRKQEK